MAYDDSSERRATFNHIGDINEMVIMNKEFIPYEQALELKELWFAIDRLNVLRYYSASGTLYEFNMNEFIIAPLYQQAFRWFREKYDLYSFIERDGSIFNAVCQHTLVRVCRTYEEAELACLKKLIEIVKNK